MANTELKNKNDRYQTAVEALNELIENDNEAPQLQPIVIYLKQQKSVISKSIIDEENVKEIHVDSPETVRK